MYEFIDKVGFSQPIIQSIENSKEQFFKENVEKNFIQLLNPMLMDKDVDVQVFLDKLKAFANDSILKNRMFYLLFYLSNIQKLWESYQKQGIDKAVFYQTLQDFSYKAEECYQVNGYYGIECPDWYPRIFRQNLYALGRFQFEYADFSQSDYCFDGITLKHGSPVLSLHIPSGGSMTDSCRLDSYCKAYDFYKNTGYFTDGIMKVICNTWMLYPPFVNIFPVGSNLSGFAKEFDVIKQTDLPSFIDGWRIFGNKYNAEHANLPQQTSLQKNFAKYLKDNHKYGLGYGVLLFDGQKIINRPN